MYDPKRSKRPAGTNPQRLVISESDEKLISIKARQLVGCYGLVASDAPDIKQSLRLKLLHALQSFDPRRGDRSAFVKAVIERSVANIVRDQKAKKRHYGRVRTLDRKVASSDEPALTLGDVLDSQQGNCRFGIRQRSCAERAEITMDVARVLESLPAPLRDLAEGLARADSLTALAEEMGIPRTTLSSRKRQLLKRFERTSLRDYL